MDLKESKVDQAPTVEKDVALGEVHDIGANLFVEAEQLSTEDLEREGAEVLRILDWRIMPIVSRRYIPYPPSNHCEIWLTSGLFIQLYVTYVIQFLGIVALIQFL
jgi:hypothetical protein